MLVYTQAIASFDGFLFALSVRNLIFTSGFYLIAQFFDQRRIRGFFMRFLVVRYLGELGEGVWLWVFGFQEKRFWKGVQVRSRGVQMWVDGSTQVRLCRVLRGFYIYACSVRVRVAFFFFLVRVLVELGFVCFCGNYCWYFRMERSRFSVGRFGCC